MNYMIRSVFNGIIVKFQALELLILMLFCFATPLFAQPTFEDALDKVLAEVVRDRISEVEVSALRSPLRRGSMEVRTWGDRVIEMPFEDAWVFMVDDAPLANWAHPCRYVFVAKDLSEIVVQRARTPLHVRQVSTRRDGVEPLDEALEVVVPYDYEQAPTRKKNGLTRSHHLPPSAMTVMWKTAMQSLSPAVPTWPTTTFATGAIPRSSIPPSPANMAIPRKTSMY